MDNSPQSTAILPLQRPLRQWFLPHPTLIPQLTHLINQRLPNHPIPPMNPTHQIQSHAQLLAVPVPRHIGDDSGLGTGIPIPRLHSLGRSGHGRRTRAQDVDARAQGPDVTLAGMHRDLGRLVGQGADEVGGRSLGGGDTEVGEDEAGVALGVIVGFDEDVGGFDVAVDDGFETFVRATVDGEAVVAEVDEGEGFGELEEGVPNEGFGDVSLVRNVGVYQTFEIASAAVVVPCCDIRFIS